MSQINQSPVKIKKLKLDLRTVNMLPVEERNLLQKFGLKKVQVISM